jgi:hypothetical protein
MVQNGARRAPFCTIFAFCGAERCSIEIYMPDRLTGTRVSQMLAITKFDGKSGAATSTNISYTSK